MQTPIYKKTSRINNPRGFFTFPESAILKIQSYFSPYDEIVEEDFLSAIKLP